MTLRTAIRSLFAPAERRLLDELIDDRRTEEEIFEFLKAQPPNAPVVKLIQESAHAPCRKGVAIWDRWLQEEKSRERAGRIRELIDAASAEALPQDRMQAVESLLVLLTIREPATQQAIAACSEPTVVEAVVQALRDATPLVWQAALQGIARLLHLPDRLLRARLSELLSAPATIDRLLTALQENRLAPIFSSAQDILYNIQNHEVIDSLFRLMCGGNRRAARALARIDWVPVGDLQRAYHLVIHGRWEALPEVGDLALEPLLLALRMEHLGRCRETAGPLAQIGGPKAFEGLLKLAEELKPAAGLMGELWELAAAEKLSVPALTEEYIKLMEAKRHDRLSERCFDEFFARIFKEFYTPHLDRIAAGAGDHTSSVVTGEALRPHVRAYFVCAFWALESLQTMERRDGLMAADAALAARFRSVEDETIRAADHCGVALSAPNTV